MSYYRVCSFCRAHLDPGEKCDCGNRGGEQDGSRNYAGGAEERVYRDLGKGSRIPVKGNFGAEEQQDGGADSL